MVYSYTFLDAVKLAFIMILRDFLFVGVIMATLLRYATLMPVSTRTDSRQPVCQQSAIVPFLSLIAR